MESLFQLQKHIKLVCKDHQYKDGSYIYSIIISIDQDVPYKYEVEKTKQQILNLHQILQKHIFQLESPFQKKHIHNKQDPQQTKTSINIYINQIKARLDCLTCRHFIDFFHLQKRYSEVQLLQKSHLYQLTQIPINVAVKQQVVDMAWQPQEKLVFLVSQCKSQKKLTNFLKSLISNNTTMNGTLHVMKFDQKSHQWVNIHNQLIQAEPTKVVWNRKCSTLIVCTLIGIYIYMIGTENDKSIVNLIDFVEIPGIQSIYCDSHLAEVYILSNGINYASKSKLYSYSIKKQLNVQIPMKLNKAKSLTFQKANRRLYISEQEGITIYKVQNDTSRLMMQNFKKIHTIKYDTAFEQLSLSSEEKPQFLFGFSNKGFISVFQVKPLQKQFLMTILTNIQCPANYSSIERIWSKKLFCVNFNDNLVFISMKNQPIWVKQNQKDGEKPRKIIYDEQNDRLIYCDNQSIRICQISF